MTSLNSKLQLAVLNRKKGHNLLEKGFTLVELMIVIVIVGVLSSVALPSFLGQKSRAFAAEAVSKGGALLQEAYTLNQEGMSNPDILTYMNTASTGPVALETAKGEWTYTMCTTTTGGLATSDMPSGSLAGDIFIKAIGKSTNNDINGKIVNVSIVYADRKPEINSVFRTTGAC